MHYGVVTRRATADRDAMLIIVPVPNPAHYRSHTARIFAGHPEVVHGVVAGEDAVRWFVTEHLGLSHLRNADIRLAQLASR